MPTSLTARSSFVVIAVIAIGVSPLAAQPAKTLAQKLDSLAGAGVARKLVVGSVVAVVKDNDTLLFKSYGKADVEWDVPMTPDALFEIGSLTKQFTAVAILQLRDQGKLSLDDDITKWLPDFDTHGNKVSLRRLLNHTSGIHDMTETPEFPSLISNRVFPRDSAYALIKRYPFDFPSGEMQQYSNSGFWLLGLVVEKASAMTYEEYVEKKLFEPLGMKRSMYCNSTENIERRAHGYGVRNGQVVRAPTNVHTWGFSAGSLCSTAADMVTWLKALHGGKVLTPASYAEMTTPAKLTEWATLRYGMGLGVYKDFNGLQLFEHGGVIAGFWTEANWYPESKTAVVVLQNSNGILDPEEVAELLAWALLRDGKPPAARERPFTGDPTLLVGRYKGRGRTGELTIEITQGPQGLMASANDATRSLPARPLVWLDAWTFRVQGIVVTFHRSGSTGPATELGFNPAKGLYFILKRQ